MMHSQFLDKRMQIMINQYNIHGTYLCKEIIQLKIEIITWINQCIGRNLQTQEESSFII